MRLSTENYLDGENRQQFIDPVAIGRDDPFNFLPNGRGVPWLSYRCDRGGDAVKWSFDLWPESEVNMGLNLPPFNGLRLFEAAARCGSFKRAAQELNLTSGAISHGITALEEWLGVELFERSRELTLTAAGLHYLPYVKEALSMIAKGTSETLARNRIIAEAVQTIATTEAIK
jgi:hypothetical protein